MRLAMWSFTQFAGRSLRVLMKITQETRYGGSKHFCVTLDY